MPSKPEPKANSFLSTSRRTPLLGVALAFTTGVVLDIPVNLACVLASVGTLICIVALKKLRWAKAEKFNGFIFKGGLAIALVGCGSVAWQVRQETPHNDIRKLDQQHITLGLRVATEATYTRYGCQTYAQVLRLKTTQDAASWSVAAGTVKLYADSSSMSALQPGNAVTAHGRLQPVEALKNQGYAAYLRQQEVYQILHVEQLQADPQEAEWPLQIAQYVVALRQYLLASLNNISPDTTTVAVAQALLLGSKARLDPEVKRAYRTAGATHILAVSGMHLTLLLGAMGFVFKKLWGTSTRAPWLVAGFVLVLYGVMVGPMGSVLRAVGMSLLLLVALLLRRKAIALNILAATWLVLVVYDPKLTYDVGLQLSAVAVLGLLLMQPLLMQIFAHRFTHTFRPLAELLSATLAAQLFTLPLVWFYFGQFPAYFILINLLAVPLGSAATLVGFVFMAMSWVPLIHGGMGWLLGLLIEGMNGFVLFTEILPLPTLVLPAISAAFTLLLGAGIVCTTCVLQAYLAEPAEPGWAFY